MELGCVILESIGLVKSIDTGFFDVSSRWSLILDYYVVTKMGFYFAKACKIVE